MLSGLTVTRPRERARCTPLREEVASVELARRRGNRPVGTTIVAADASDASGATEARGDPADQPGQRERALVLHRADLIATELAEVAVDQQRRDDHHDEPDARDPDGDDDQDSSMRIPTTNATAASRIRRARCV